MGTYMANDEEVIARITPAVNFFADPVKGCWEWTRPANSWGYGQTTVRGKRVAIHRLVYELFIGPIPEGDFVIDHMCQNRLCVNPSHLQVVTRGENCALSHLRNTHCAQGHPFDGPNLRVDRHGHRKCRICEQSSNRRSRDKKRHQSTTTS